MVRGAFFMVALGIGLAGCERGCLATWLGDHGVGGVDPPVARHGSPGVGGSGRDGSSSHGAPATGIDLGGTDCSDGLARCIDGHVEVSVGGHVKQPCTAPKELPGACACEWRSAGSCANGCVKDGLEVVADPEVATPQLCRASGPVTRVATPAESADVTICADDGVSCADGKVRACSQRGQPASLVVVCVHGCASHVALDPDDVRTGDGAAEILCRRDHAERQ